MHERDHGVRTEMEELPRLLDFLWVRPTPMCSYLHRSAPVWRHFGHFTYMCATADAQTIPRN